MCSKSDKKCRSGIVKTFSSCSFVDCQWVFVDTPENRGSLSRIRPRFDSEIYLLAVEPGSRIAHLTEVYSVEEAATATPVDVVFNRIETWLRIGDVGRLDIVRRGLPLIWARRNNLMGAHFTVKTQFGDAGKMFGKKIQHETVF